MSNRIHNAIRRRARAWGAAAVHHGLVRPERFDYRWVPEEPARPYLANGRGQIETVHTVDHATNALPLNVSDRDDLPRDPGWWGYSFWNVPDRVSGETYVATVPDARVVPLIESSPYTDTEGQFYPAILSSNGTSLRLREVRFHPGHADVLRQSGRPVRMDRATWVLERVYDNHSHWLTAHVPKLALLKERDQLDHVVLPEARTPVMDATLRQLGLDPRAFPTFDPGRPLEVGELTILGTDRFRPELLRLVRAAFEGVDRASPHRRLYISRARAARRRLLDEDAVWSFLERAGFERVFLEEVSFIEQVRLMQEAEVVVAPHGAGLTNVLFCTPGTHVVEIADLSFPNPNFYAVSAAMGLRYSIVRAQGIGDVHPLEKDLRVEVADVERALEPALS